MQHVSPNVVGVHYRVGRKVGEGSFGVIYEGTNLLNNMPVAIKFEPRKTDAPQLRDEYRTYKILAGVDGIPSVYYFGQEGLYSVLCIDLLGPSLEDMFDICRRKFSVKTTAILAKQMLTLIQSVHEHNLIYRDIKPDNFILGRQNTSNAGKVFLIDFGMAKQYRDPKTHQHIPYKERKSLSGTARYMSINTHLGREQSRRDDLESIGHVLMYFLRGALPWQGLKAATNRQKYERIGEKKQRTPVNELCEGFPEEFKTYMTTVRNYAFEETPDYDSLRALMDSAIKRCGEVDDGIYDWMFSGGIYGNNSMHYKRSPPGNTTSNNNNNNNNNNTNNNANTANRVSRLLHNSSVAIHDMEIQPKRDTVMIETIPETGFESSDSKNGVQFRKSEDTRARRASKLTVENLIRNIGTTKRQSYKLNGGLDSRRADSSNPRNTYNADSVHLTSNYESSKNEPIYTPNSKSTSKYKSSPRQNINSNNNSNNNRGFAAKLFSCGCFT
ncbi:Casein kinase I-like protein [Zancudomyces culisetae]|uniref:non-specific serine/threonine protein kinase n=1 Tax=Zancudomyces culisetae TaxID=1213189 RepID=A0A1R1PVY9_ZANCU|nr:Casein kinase I-like protein [Zancudomyces culisetae]|eukprot:OMH85146.1 Casein kinase I-like protein [Zancudomyces culisetae]